MGKKELISVIIPVYNKESVIQRCLESVIGQSYKNLQIIIVNDGSKDDSLAICREYEKKDERIVVLDRNNSGAGSARNAGLDIVSGEYICFVDSDDSVKENYIDCLYDTLKANKCDIACCNYEVEMNGKQQHSNEKSEMIPQMDAIKLMWHDGKIKIAPWGKLYKSELWNGIRFKECYAGEDYATTYKVFFRTHTIAYNGEPLYIYHYEQGSLTHSFNKKKCDLIDVAQEVINDCDYYHPELSVYARTKGFDIACQYYCQADSSNQGHYDGYNEKALKMIYEYRADVFRDTFSRNKSVVAALLSYISPMLIRNLYRLWWKQ